MTSLHDERLRQALEFTADQARLRFAIGLMDRETFDFYRVQWCRKHGHKAWNAERKGTLSVVNQNRKRRYDATR